MQIRLVGQFARYRCTRLPRRRIMFSAVPSKALLKLDPVEPPCPRHSTCRAHRGSPPMQGLQFWRDGRLSRLLNSCYSPRAAVPPATNAVGVVMRRRFTNNIAPAFALALLAASASHALEPFDAFPPTTSQILPAGALKHRDGICVACGHGIGRLFISKQGRTRGGGFHGDGRRVERSILDALAPLCVTDVPMPAAPESIWARYATVECSCKVPIFT